MAIYTKTGDDGTTSLVGGRRVSKCCTRLEAYGTVDELNSHLGLLRTVCIDETAGNIITDIQNTLFGIGALLATEDGTGDDGSGHRGERYVRSLESQIDRFQQDLPPWRGFTLPGGSPGAAQANVCRAVCRRAERCILRLSMEATVSPWILRYVNRLSDLLYVMALRENRIQGRQEILWKK